MRGREGERERGEVAYQDERDGVYITLFHLFGLVFLPMLTFYTNASQNDNQYEGIVLLLSNHNQKKMLLLLVPVLDGTHAHTHTHNPVT